MPHMTSIPIGIDHKMHVQPDKLKITESIYIILKRLDDTSLLRWSCKLLCNMSTSKTRCCTKDDMGVAVNRKECFPSIYASLIDCQRIPGLLHSTAVPMQLP